MRTFYVRPACDAGYGRGDGTSYDSAWNGFESVDWQALAGEPATLWACGGCGDPGGFVILCVEWSYLKNHDLPARTDPRRESPVAV